MSAAKRLFRPFSLLMPRALLFFAGISLASLAGCGWLETTAPQNAANPRNAARNAQTNRAEHDRALATWIEALGRKATGEAPPDAPAQKPAARLVYVRLTEVARRHPAWQLADALERNPQTDLRVNIAAPATPNAPQTPRTPRNLDFDGSTRDMSTRIGRDASGGAISARSASVASRRETAEWLPPLQNSLEERQRSALSAFLDGVAQQQQNEREARAADLRGALEERIAQHIEAVERNAWLADAPVSPSPETQLEMTNLRLKLASNLAMSSEERAQAQNRLAELEDEWRRALQNSESQRRSALERARIEEPQRMRAEGQEQINSLLGGWQNRDAEQRRAAAQSQQSLLAQDFASARFGIVLPSYETFGPGSLAATPRSTPALRFDAFNLSETTAPKMPSIAPLRPPAMPRAVASTRMSTQKTGAMGNTSTASALRERAWNETRRWVEALARQNGWRVTSERSAKTSDVTPQVLRQLDAM
jgi:hypothetical protein